MGAFEEAAVLRVKKIFIKIVYGWNEFEFEEEEQTLVKKKYQKNLLVKMQWNCYFTKTSLLQAQTAQTKLLFYKNKPAAGADASQCNSTHWAK